MIQQPGVALLAMVGFLTFAARAMSGDHWSRNEENLKYQSFLKLWKLRYEYRKTARIFMCEKCGKFIRVPKGKGKIQLTCPRCGTRMIRRS
jgi:DNA-directed RNA polymerase subunit RPC12/RpoP